MTQTADRLPESAPLSRDLLLRVREAPRQSDAAEVLVLELAVEYAAANPALPGQAAWEPAQAPSWLEDTYELLPDGDREGNRPPPFRGGEPGAVALPLLRWDAPAAFAAANEMTTTAGKAVLRDALLLAHRLPDFWTEVR